MVGICEAENVAEVELEQRMELSVSVLIGRSWLRRLDRIVGPFQI